MTICPPGGGQEGGFEAKWLSTLPLETPFLNMRLHLVSKMQFVSAEGEDIAFVYPFGIDLLSVELDAIRAAQVFDVERTVVVDDSGVLSGNVGILDGQI